MQNLFGYGKNMISNDDIIHVDIPENIIIVAKQQASDMGVLNGSFRKGSGNIIGFIGELLICQYANVQQVDRNSDCIYDYDLVIKNIKCDVKSKEVTTWPNINYECSIEKFNTSQQCDIYIFTRIMRDFSSAWILGWIPKITYFNKCYFVSKGFIDPKNNKRIPSDRYNILIEQLQPAKMLFKKTKNFKNNP